MNISGLWDQLVDAVCRPPRDDQYTEVDLVGGRRAAFRLYHKRYYRQDVTLVNPRGQKLQCSHFRPCVVTSSDGRMPCVIYCHCNSGSRRDAEEILYHMLPKGLTVFAFDFAGSGLSEGSYVTLGALEVDDLAAVVQYLREEGSTSTIGLWGRSMGAVTALLYSQQDPSVAGMVLDSPFSRLVDLMLELGTDQQLRIPKPFIKMALSMLKRSVRKRAGFSVDKVAPLDCVGQSFIPALFGHAGDDTFVNKHHSERLFEAYAGDKNYVSFTGDHNSVRPDFFYDSALIFLVQALRVADLVGPDIDLQAMPEEQLPHLHARGNTIYVTACKSSAEGLEDEGEEAGEGGAAAYSSGSSPRSPHSPRRGSLHRTLSPPWRMASPAGRAAAQQERAAAAAGAVGSFHPGPSVDASEDGEQQQQQRQQGGQLASLLDAEHAESLFLGEDEALQRALALSLQEAHQQQQGQLGQQQQQQEEGEAPGAAASNDAEQQQGQGQAGSQQSGSQQSGSQHQAAEQHEEAAEPSRHTRYNPTSGAEGRRNPLYVGSSAADVPQDVPLNPDEEEAMLAAAIAASLKPQQEAAAAAPTTAASPLLPVPSVEDGQPGAAGSSSGAASGAGAAQEAAGAGAAKQGSSSSGQEQEQGEQEGDEVLPEQASSRAAQASADAHAGQEAAAAREPSRQLQRALSGALPPQPHQH